MKWMFNVYSATPVRKVKLKDSFGTIHVQIPDPPTQEYINIVNPVEHHEELLFSSLVKFPDKHEKMISIRFLSVIHPKIESSRLGIVKFKTISGIVKYAQSSLYMAILKHQKPNRITMSEGPNICFWDMEKKDKLVAVMAEYIIASPQDLQDEQIINEITNQLVKAGTSYE